MGEKHVGGVPVTLLDKLPQPYREAMGGSKRMEEVLQSLREALLEEPFSSSAHRSNQLFLHAVILRKEWHGMEKYRELYKRARAYVHNIHYWVRNQPVPSDTLNELLDIESPQPFLGNVGPEPLPEEEPLSSLEKRIVAGMKKVPGVLDAAMTIREDGSADMHLTLEQPLKFIAVKLQDIPLPEEPGVTKAYVDAAMATRDIKDVMTMDGGVKLEPHPVPPEALTADVIGQPLRDLLDRHTDPDQENGIYEVTRGPWKSLVKEVVGIESDYPSAPKRITLEEAMVEGLKAGPGLSELATEPDDEEHKRIYENARQSVLAQLTKHVDEPELFVDDWESVPIEQVPKGIKGLLEMCVHNAYMYQLAEASVGRLLEEKRKEYIRAQGYETLLEENKQLMKDFSIEGDASLRDVIVRYNRVAVNLAEQVQELRRTVRETKVTVKDAVAVQVKEFAIDENPMEWLHQRIAYSLPQATFKMMPPEDRINGVWWLDCTLEGHSVLVRWSVMNGLGIDSPREGEDGYGTGPHEIPISAQVALERVINLLLHKLFTEAPGAKEDSDSKV